MRKTKKSQEVTRFNVKRIFYYFWRALMRHKIRTFLILLLIPIWIFIMNILVPRGTSVIIGQLSTGDFELKNYINILLLILIPVAFNDLILIRIVDWLDWSLDAKGGQYLSELAFEAVINQSMNFHSDNFSGSLTSQANKLPNAFINLKSQFFWDIYPLFLSFIFAIVAASVVCLPFALILLAFVVVFISFAVVTFYKTKHIDAGLASAENKQTGALADSITNELSVKAYAREQHERRRFRRATEHTKAATFAVAKVSMWRNFCLNIFSLITSVAILILLIMSHNLFGLSIANIVFLYSLSTSLLSRVWRINPILHRINRALGDAKEMVEILDMPYAIDDTTNRALKIKQATIEFSHIEFRHQDTHDALFTDFSLTIPAGKRIGLIGISGSGKTTLTKLLLRFDDVSAGAIYIDGQNICDVTQSSLRQNIAYVPQEATLFHRSVRDNIAYGKPGASEREITRAAKLANADAFIKELPDGYNTLVGERGVKLSGGQRQRIAIARAILKDAPILVLDEATSALDSESEALIQEALNNLMKGRTSVVIAHRLSTVAGLDEIIVLDDGEIIEQGTHQELLEKQGAYQKLWSRQSGAFLKDENTK